KTGHLDRLLCAGFFHCRARHSVLLAWHHYNSCLCYLLPLVAPPHFYVVLGRSQGQLDAAYLARPRGRLSLLRSRHAYDALGYFGSLARRLYPDGAGQRTWERAVLVRHALKNALLPVITVIGLEFAFLVGGLVVTEQVFNLNGIGKLFVE